MTTKVYRKKRIDTDVLCIGGGIAGLMAAIRAAECKARVLIAEKSNVLYSGSGGAGNDHFMCYIPEVHGNDIESHVTEFQRGQQGGIRNRTFIRRWLERSFDIVKLWENWGIPMKYNGKYEFAGHALPGELLTHLHYAGKNQKKVLTEQATKRGVKIINRTMCYNLLYDKEGVCGAIGINTDEDEILEIRCSSVVLGTGSVMRLYPAPTPGWMFNTRLSPTCVGDGRAMAYRAGVELASMEIPLIRCGPKYFSRAGKATWAGVLKDPIGKPVGPFVDKPDNKYGDPVVDVYQDIFIDYKKSGRGPVYMDCGGLSDEELAYMLHWLKNEGNESFLNSLEADGIDIRKNPIEFWTYENELFPRGGVYYNEEGETSVEGLYAAGDEFFGGISGAAVFGWIAGEGAAGRSPTRREGESNQLKSQIDENSSVFTSLRRRENGATWKEANILLQQIMWDYAGLIRSETLLDAGLAALLRLKDKAHETLVARNSHELIRCLEVLNMIEIGEIIFQAARERKETRGKHTRVDYPFTNPLLEKLLVVKKTERGLSFQWRSLKR
jgi:succinate dehydrogenase/fumarate reductase flavoprotein subunit